MPETGGMLTEKGSDEIPSGEAGTGVTDDGTVISWLIIGGGIHGTYLSHYLYGRIGLPAESIRVLDPYPEALDRWKSCAANTGMRILRSPAAHHLDYVSLSLKRMAPPFDPSMRAGLSVPPLNEPYGRPSLELFNRHADSIIKANSLKNMRLRGRATAISEEKGLYRIRYTDTRDAAKKELRAHNVVLAIGMGEETYYPEWAEKLKREGAAVAHIFDPDFDTEEISEKNKRG